MSFVRRKVVVAMSGGVDSSVAAALLKRAGHDVTGVTMRLVDLPVEACRSEDLRSCCGRRAVEDAHRVALSLKIPHYVADMRIPFANLVVSEFCREYARGRTPNPCVLCNRLIKFGLLLEKARELGADHLATGHYARVVREARRGTYSLKKASDLAKDQSYFLYAMTQDQLARVLFPLGGRAKTEVRRLAKRMGLAVADKSESQEICFVPGDDYGGFLRERIPAAFRPGPVVALDGRLLGEHGGVAGFTVGQRRGMGVAASGRLYVVSVDALTNTVVAGPDEALRSKGLVASGVGYISGKRPPGPFRARVKIRYRHSEAAAVVTPVGAAGAHVVFLEPQRAVAPGQSVVFYRRNTVIGGGTIESAVRQFDNGKEPG
jgi:tRNA-specific 2-thiouridylase